ncbi:hypothetical protein FUAX_43670 (plasmid) [Fulvitalea axinellae]|uniref:Uncharacterized protein n=1 Tax=Fulvitalea axinellae TaxID=1182444 RepID=A0AAU9DL35_9BACT|nr:hypothetical protein FUAX_43670 [Fulvitalea axinellae]
MKPSDLDRIFETRDAELFCGAITKLYNEKAFAARTRLLNAFQERARDLLLAMDIGDTEAESIIRADLDFFEKCYSVFQDEGAWVWYSWQQVRVELLRKYFETDASERDPYFRSRLETLADREDLGNIRFLADDILDMECPENREAVIDALHDCVYQYLYDIHCGKMGDDPIFFLEEVLDNLAYLEELEREGPLCEEKLQVYLVLFKKYPDRERKRVAIEKALEQFDHWDEATKKKDDFHSQRAEALFKYAKFENRLDHEVVGEIMDELERAFATEEDLALRQFLQLKYDLWIAFGEDKALVKTLETFEKRQFEKDKEKDLYNILEWINAKRDLTEWMRKELPDALIQREKLMMAMALPDLTDYKTESPGRLGALGNAFYKQALEMPECLQQYRYFCRALGFLTKQIHLAEDKRYLVYTYGKVMRKAVQYLKNKGEDIIADRYLNSALSEFERSYQAIGKDLSMCLHYADFLLFVAEKGVDFDAPQLWKRAGDFYRIAKGEGDTFYSQPYIGLAKVALLQGDRPTAEEYLRTCDELFSNEYHAYDFKEFANDSVFDPVRDLIKQLIEARRKLVRPTTDMVPERYGSMLVPKK